jgi:DNA-binding MarR family transcriptional regulator
VVDVAAQAKETTDRLGFLLARHGRVMNVRLRQALAVCNLSPRHGAVLMRLAHAGNTSQQDLLEALAIDASALVAILNELERDGLIERHRDLADRRRHIVAITPSGAKIAHAAERAIDEVEQDAFADLDEAEISMLHTLLGRVHSRHDERSCAGD